MFTRVHMYFHLFHFPLVIHLLPGEHGEILGETRGGVGKVGGRAQKRQYVLNALMQRKSYYGGPLGSHQHSLE